MTQVRESLVALKISVVVPTYRRPRLLRACLDGLLCQTRLPDEVVVVYRESDGETASVLKGFDQRVARVLVKEPGQVAALRAGVNASTGNAVAFLDDDAVPRPSWLESISEAFARTDAAAVGGRDVVHHGEVIEGGCARVVGRLLWYGKAHGNHHLGCGLPRRVDFLKGCNSAYRREVLSLPMGLLGRGAQVGNDMATSLAVSQAGWTVLYDPSIVVDHHSGQRFDSDSRDGKSRQAADDAVFNLCYTVGSLAGNSLSVRYLLYHVVIGDATSPGILRSVLAYLKNERAVKGRFCSTQRAMLLGYVASRRRPLEMWRAPLVCDASDEVPSEGRRD